MVNASRYIMIVVVLLVACRASSCGLYGDSIYRVGWYDGYCSLYHDPVLLFQSWTVAVTDNWVQPGAMLVGRLNGMYRVWLIPF